MNSLSACIIADLSSKREEYLSAIAASKQCLLNAMESQNKPTIMSTLTPATQVANATTTLTVDAEILQLLQSINEKLNNKGNSNENGNRNGKGKGSGKPRRKNTSKYCWTHGACAHDSHAYTNCADGHQVDATFADKKGGSTLYCQASN